MALLDSIQTARDRGASEEDILEAIIQNNAGSPVASSIDTARSRGFSDELILQKIQEQNQGASAPAPEPTPLAETKQGQLSQSILDSALERGSQLVEGVKRQFIRPDISQGSAGISGPVSGFLNDLIGDAAVAAIPDETKEQLGQKLTAFLDTPVGRFTSGALGLGKSASDIIAQVDPELGDEIRDTLNTIDAAAGGKGILTAGRATKPIARNVAGEAAGAVEGRLAKQILDDAISITAPRLSRSQKASAIAQGRGKTTGILRTLEIAPSPSDIRAAKSVQDLVVVGRAPDKNIGAVRGAITNKSEEISEGLVGSGIAYKADELSDFLAKAKNDSSILFKADEALEREYDVIIKEMLDQAVKSGDNLDNLWDARKAFDQVVEQKLSSRVFTDPGNNVKRNAILDVRRATNEFIANKLPEGNSFRDDLRKLSDQYTAIDNIASEAASLVNSNIVKRSMNKLGRLGTVQSVLASAGIVGAASAGLFNNPAILLALLAGGTIKIAGNVVTSQTLKEILIKTLRSAEKLLSAEETEAIEAVLSFMEETA